MNSFINSNSFFFLSRNFKFSKYKIVPSVNKDNFTSFFTTQIHFTSFSFLIALADISSTVLDRRGKSGHPCLTPNLRRKAFSFPPLSMMSAVGFSYICFFILNHL